MADNRRYFVVTEKAVPDVLLKVVEAKRLLDIQKSATVQEAVEAVGISRSSFYKYKDDIFPFKEKTRERILLLLFRWRMSRDCFRLFWEPLQNSMEIY